MVSLAHTYQGAFPAWMGPFDAQLISVHPSTAKSVLSGSGKHQIQPVAILWNTKFAFLYVSKLRTPIVITENATITLFSKIL